MDPNTAERLRSLYEEHFEYVLRTARRLGASTENVDDVVQDTFLVVAKKLPELDLDRPIRPFLFGVVRHRVRTARRTSTKTQRGVDRPAPSDGLPQEEAEAVYAMLRSLPEELRAALILSDVEGYTHAEVATILGTRETQARSWIRRARAAARAYLEVTHVAE